MKKYQYGEAKWKSNSPLYFHVITRVHPTDYEAMWHVCLRIKGSDEEELLTQYGFNSKKQALEKAIRWRDASGLKVPVIVYDGNKKKDVVKWESKETPLNGRRK